jgi:hypothetical protein
MSGPNAVAPALVDGRRDRLRTWLRGRATPADGDQVHARRWAILAVLCLSVFIALIDNTIVNVALPSMSEQLGPFAMRAGNAPGTRAQPAARPRPPSCSPRREPTASRATTGTGARCASAGSAAGRRGSSATPATASPTCAAGATRARSGNAHAAGGRALASGLPPVSRSAAAATPATSVPA